MWRIDRTADYGASQEAARGRIDLAIADRAVRRALRADALVAADEIRSMKLRVARATSPDDVARVADELVRMRVLVARGDLSGLATHEEIERAAGKLPGLVARLLPGFVLLALGAALPGPRLIPHNVPYAWHYC
jgi:hypothetical protein